MKLDLAAAANLNATSGKGARAIWAGGKIEINEEALIGQLADALATVMGQNLNRGYQPDGLGSMPGRKKDGKPRGQGSAISLALASVPQGNLTWLIAAHRERAGHLARIMQEVAFRAPRLDSLPPAVIKRCWERATSTSMLGEALRGEPSAIAGVLRSGRKTNLGRTLGGKASLPVSFAGVGQRRLGGALRQRSSGVGAALRGPRQKRTRLW